MKTSALNLLIFFALFLTSCSRKDSQTSSLNGTYEGTFALTNNDPLANTVPLSGDVVVTFSKNGYHTTAQINNTVAGGQGKYSIKNKEISFTDTILRTAYYDVSFLLSGSYIHTIKNDSLILVKKYGYSAYTYKLRKK